jgi:hypothetical protein
VGSVQERQTGLPEPRALHRRLLAGSSPTAGPPEPFWPVNHRTIEPGRRVMVTRQPGHRPLVEVLYVGECPYYVGALALVERGRAELGIETELRTSLIGDQVAERARFPGSSTIRVDGRDVEPGSEPSAELSVACRLYRLEHRLASRPRPWPHGRSSGDDPRPG